MQRTKTKTRVTPKNHLCPRLIAYFKLDGEVFERARIQLASEEYKGRPTFEAKKKAICEKAGHKTAQVELRAGGNKTIRTFDLHRKADGWQTNFFLSLDEGSFTGFARITVTESGLLHGTVRLSLMVRT